MRGVAFSPDSRRLASASDDETAQIRDVETELVGRNWTVTTTG